jgi:hypothetical protein
MAIRMYVEHSVIISTLVSHNSVEINLGKKALQLLEGHARFMRCFYGSRTNLSSQASPNFHVRPRLTDGYRFRDSLPIFNSPQAQIADPVPETLSAFDPLARRRDVRLQSRSSARWNQSLGPSPNGNRLC